MSIKIESIKDVKNTVDVKYQDLMLDFNYSYTQNSEFLKTNEIKDLKVSYDINAIRNSIQNMFLTNRGEKLLNPYFGIGLGGYVFEQVSESTAKDIGDAIVNNIATFEPRIKLNNVNISANEEDNSYTISLIISITQLNIESLNLTGVLNNNGFTFV